MRSFWINAFWQRGFWKAGFWEGMGLLPMYDVHDGGDVHKKERQAKQDRRAALERTYEEIIEGKVFADEAAQIVRPYAKSEAARPALAAIDFEAVVRNVKARQQLEYLAVKLQRSREDAEDLEDMATLQ